MHSLALYSAACW